MMHGQKNIKLKLCGCRKIKYEFLIYICLSYTDPKYRLFQIIYH